MRAMCGKIQKLKRSIGRDLRELLGHGVFVSLSGAEGHQGQFSRAAVQAELGHVVAERVLVGHGEVQLLALIQEALGHLHHPVKKKRKRKIMAVWSVLVASQTTVFRE